MVFGTKPKKRISIKPKDKRRISLLNADYKQIEAVYGKRLSKIAYKYLSPVHYVTGYNCNIHHGISRAYDAIHLASKRRTGCGIADTDFIAAFDWMVLS